MLQVTEEALAKIEELLRAEGGEKSAVRVAVMGGGSQGPGLGLVVDEPGDGDVTFDVGGVPMLIEANLLNYCKSVVIDFTTGASGKCGGASGSGFVIVPENPVNF